MAVVNEVGAQREPIIKRSRCRVALVRQPRDAVAVEHVGARINSFDQLAPHILTAWCSVNCAWLLRARALSFTKDRACY